jgi:cobyrinic acid a,c-diamide synthase
MLCNRPRLTVSALRGGAGKTVLSLGLLAAWKARGSRVAPFKKGPDFIDSGWLSLAAGRPCYNLDPFLMNGEDIAQSFVAHSEGADLALIEGNRGLFDGMDIEGCCSTAELAKILKSPVVIIVDVTMATRTVAALVKGCQAFDPSLVIGGVILNRVGASRQESLIRNSIERHCRIPVLGAVPRQHRNPFPERHMGLIPSQERERAEHAVTWAREIVERHLQLDDLWNAALKAEAFPIALQDPVDFSTQAHERPRIGVLRDKAFWFYYPDNLAELERRGATLVEISAISDLAIPSVEALYIGGGFPETQALALANNRAFRESLRKKIEDGLPVYAECGGLMYLGGSLLVEGNAYPMVGVLPVDFVLEKRPQGHGYTVLETQSPNPYYPVGTILKGHEFHYSRAVIREEAGVHLAFRVKRGVGLDGKRDGFVKKNVLATYTHIHAGGNRDWAGQLVAVAQSAMRLREKRAADKKSD